MPDVIEMAVDRISRTAREDLFVKLLMYAGGPECESYVDWCKTCEAGIAVLYPSWAEIDRLDATIEFRKWCEERTGSNRGREWINRLLDALTRKIL